MLLGSGLSGNVILDICPSGWSKRRTIGRDVRGALDELKVSAVEDEDEDGDGGEEMGRRPPQQ